VSFDQKAYHEGDLTPVYFGSALNNFGVRELLRGVAELAPAPLPQPALGHVWLAVRLECPMMPGGSNDADQPGVSALV
jgi:peptide subunit release factor RF-3